MEKIKLSANVFFSGIGFQERGIEMTGLFDLDVKCTSDIDKEAVLSYAAIHCGLTKEMVEEYQDYPSIDEMIEQLSAINLGYDPQKDKTYDWAKLGRRKTKEIHKYWLANKLSKNVGDISRLQSIGYADLWTYSFPCTDISIAGKQAGTAIVCNECGHKFNPLDYDINERYTCPECLGEDLKGTRSGLLVEVERLIQYSVDNNIQPKYLLLENVAALVSKKFINDFNSWLKRLDKLGYNSYWKILNAKDCGVPQNRERVFCLSIRKDIDNGKFTFPTPFDNGLRVRDMLDRKVDEKYYLSDEIQDRFQVTDETMTKNIVGTTAPEFRTIGQSDLVYNTGGHMGTLLSRDYKQPHQILVKKE